MILVKKAGVRIARPWRGGLHRTRTVFQRPESATGGGRRKNSIDVNDIREKAGARIARPRWVVCIGLEPFHFA